MAQYVVSRAEFEAISAAIAPQLIGPENRQLPVKDLAISMNEGPIRILVWKGKR